MRTTRVAAVGILSVVASLFAGSAALAGSGPVNIAAGLNNPRQLTFSPNGSLYVAEAGLGDPAYPDGAHCQKSEEFGTACMGLTGSVSKIGADGHVDPVVTGLPSAGNAQDLIGPSDLTFTGNYQFGLSFGLGGTPAYRAGFGPDATLLGTVATGDLRKPNGGVTKSFDVAANELKNNPDGTDIDSNAVGLARWGNQWVVADAGGNAVVSSRKGGSTIAVLPPVPTTQVTTLPFPPFTIPAGFPADSVPTDVVRGPDGAWYVSELVGFPFEKGSSTIYRVVPGETPQPYAWGLTNVTSLAFADDGSLYAVEMASNGLLAGPVGSLLRIHPGASHDVVAGGLFAPYGVAIRGTSAYVTTCSVCGPGGGVVKIHI